MIKIVGMALGALYAIVGIGLGTAALLKGGDFAGMPLFLAGLPASLMIPENADKVATSPLMAAFILYIPVLLNGFIIYILVQFIGQIYSRARNRIRSNL